MEDCWAYKSPKNVRNRSRGLLLRGDSLPKSVNFWYFGAAFPPLRRLRWIFAQPGGHMCPSDLPSLTWIGARSRPCGAKTWFLAYEQGGICRGKPGNFSLTGSDLPSHWFVWKLRGMERGRGGKGKGGGDHLPYFPLPLHWLLPQIPPCLWLNLIPAVYPGGKKTYKQKNIQNDPHCKNPISACFRTYSRRALFDLPQTLHGDRARRDH